MPIKVKLLKLKVDFVLLLSFIISNAPAMSFTVVLVALLLKNFVFKTLKFPPREPEGQNAIAPEIGPSFPLNTQFSKLTPFSF